MAIIFHKIKHILYNFRIFRRNRTLDNEKFFPILLNFLTKVTISMQPQKFIQMSTSIKTTSEKQMDQIRRFVKKNKIYNTITLENGVYTITLFGLTCSESEKFIKSFTKANHLTKVQQEPQAIAA